MNNFYVNDSKKKETTYSYITHLLTNKIYFEY